jgi:NADPH:quinone reductase-like Zn-dependent oxidoreductase
MQSEAVFLIKYGESNTAFEKRVMILPDLKAEEVCIEVESFGLNYADVMARNKMYREAPPLPAILGYDVVGKVVNIGKNADENLLGKRVLAFTRFGGYAKHVNTSFKSVVEVENLEANKALALGTQYVTAYYMCEYLTTIHENENALIHAGAGGVGLALIQILKAKKVIIFAKVSSDEKCDFVLNNGANFAINYKKSDYIQQLSTVLILWEAQHLKKIYNF